MDQQQISGTAKSSKGTYSVDYGFLTQYLFRQYLEHLWQVCSAALLQWIQVIQDALSKMPIRS
jgi:hypothetical protein